MFKRISASRILFCLVCAILIFSATTYVQSSYGLYNENRIINRCHSRLYLISNAIVMYQIDNNSHFPDSLERLTPHYMKTLPVCPVSKTNTYAYEASDHLYLYTLYCKNNYHLKAKIPAGVRNYNSYNGFEDSGPRCRVEP